MVNLTLREVQILSGLCDPAMSENLKVIANKLGITPGSIKIYTSHLHGKLHIKGGVRGLVLFALTHREALGIPLPSPEQFAVQQFTIGGNQ